MSIYTCDLSVSKGGNFYVWITIIFIKHFACDIRQKLPKSTKLPHPTGIVIAGGCCIGENVKINQNTTIGVRYPSDDERYDSDRYPTIEDNVWICSGAVVLGNVTIGENSIVGANATVIRDAPPNSTAVGTPAKIL